MATVKDIARHAGVSPTTVSWALNGKHVSKHALEKVLKAAEELNYHRKSSARSLRSGKVFSVGLYVVSANLDDPLNVGYLFPLLAGISKTLSSQGYSMQFEVITPTTTDVLIKKASEHSIDGILILPQFSGVTATIQDEFRDENFPMVFLESDPAVDSRCYVAVDHFKGATMVIHHLYSLGHRDIAMITGSANHVDNQIRVKACLSALNEVGLRMKDHWFKQGTFTIQDSYQCMSEILSTGDYPTAVFCLNDAVAVGAMRAIYHRGLRIPEDISVIGFDDTDVAEAANPPLTTVRQPLFEQGQISAQLLLELINGRTVDVMKTLIDPLLIERESVASRQAIH